MKITIYGSGYVGLVAAACFSEVGNEVLCVDIDADKVERLSKGECPIYEPGLADILKSSIQAERLRFTTDFSDGVAHGLFQCIAVGTPETKAGEADLSQVFAVAEKIGALMSDEKIIVHKSTVPVGTAHQVHKKIESILKERRQSLKFTVVSNPEFLKEGGAIEDFRKPDRIILGVDAPQYIERLKKLYMPFNRNHDRLIFMDCLSAELTKYAANAMLATKVSFMNDMANMAEKMGADIEMVRIGMGADPRIGYHFIYPGCGYGGSCFPKDMRALIAQAKQHDYDLKVVQAVESVNDAQKQVVFRKLKTVLGELQNKTIAIWGLSFKPGTDDMRQAPSVALIEQLITHEAAIQAYDPHAMEVAQQLFGHYNKIRFCDTQYEALEQADALVILTEWRIFRSPDFHKIKSALNQPIIIDGRNVFDPTFMKERGFQYEGIGR